LNPGGDMAIGWKEVDSDWYYFDDSGAAVTDWLLSGGKWFYFDYIDYTMETGSREIDGVNYNFREDGSLIE
jgi:glucan-binding YG repeat protein